MTRTRGRGSWSAVAIVIAFFAGMVVDESLHRYGPPIPASVRARVARADFALSPSPAAVATAPSTGRIAPARAPADSDRVRVAATTGSRSPGPLRVPIDGANVESWKGAFDERRDNGARGHEAVDILSPRNTPVHAVSDGTIVKIFESKAGGHTVYQFDDDGRLCYYYAHLERYADGLHEGQRIRQGDVIGYVGTSGNAPANTPHLHFAVFRLDDAKRWWKGTPLDPYEVFTKGPGA